MNLAGRALNFASSPFNLLFFSTNALEGQNSALGLVVLGKNLDPALTR